MRGRIGEPLQKRREVHRRAGQGRRSGIRDTPGALTRDAARYDAGARHERPRRYDLRDPDPDPRPPHPRHARSCLAIGGPVHAAVLRLADYWGESPEEIAEVLGLRNRHGPNCCSPTSSAGGEPIEREFVLWVDHARENVPALQRAERRRGQAEPLRPVHAPRRSPDTAKAQAHGPRRRACPGTSASKAKSR